jgi:hypothetical protein
VGFSNCAAYMSKHRKETHVFRADDQEERPKYFGAIIKEQKHCKKNFVVITVYNIVLRNMYSIKHFFSPLLGQLIKISNHYCETL